MAKVRVIDNTARLMQAARRVLPAAVRAGALVIETDVKQRLGQSTYPPASAPGQAPAVRTGTLRRGVMTEVREEGERVVARVGPDATVDYAKALEFGTSKMAARPFMRPSYETTKDEAKGTMREQLAAGMRV